MFSFLALPMEGPSVQLSITAMSPGVHTRHNIAIPNSNSRPRGIRTPQGTFITGLLSPRCDSLPLRRILTTHCRFRKSPIPMSSPMLSSKQTNLSRDTRSRRHRRFTCSDIAVRRRWAQQHPQTIGANKSKHGVVRLSRDRTGPASTGDHTHPPTSGRPPLPTPFQILRASNSNVCLTRRPPYHRRKPAVGRPLRCVILRKVQAIIADGGSLSIVEHT